MFTIQERSVLYVLSLKIFDGCPKLPELKGLQLSWERGPVAFELPY